MACPFDRRCVPRIAVGILLGWGACATLSFGQAPEEMLEPEPTGDVPVEVPSDLIEPSFSSTRPTVADRFARFFSVELRDLESRQGEILGELEGLPGFTQEAVKSVELGFHSATTSKRPKWVQVDLGKRVEPDAVALAPVTVQFESRPEPGYGFPRAFRIDISDDPEFREYETMVDYREPRGTDLLLPKQAPFFAVVGGYSGRYVRVTATHLWRPTDRDEPSVFALGELMVIKGELNVAAGQPVTALDSVERIDLWSRRYLTDGRTSLGVPHKNLPSPTLGYSSNWGKDETKWVQVDLGQDYPVDEIRLIPAIPENFAVDLNVGFPGSFRVDVAQGDAYDKPKPVARFRSERFTNPGSNPVIVSVGGKKSRFVRITVEREGKGNLSFALAELQVFSGDENVALGKPVEAKDSRETEEWSTEFLVDGYSSRYKLTGYRDWLDALNRRGELIKEWRLLEEKRLDLVDHTVEAGVRWGGIGLGLAGMFLVSALVRGRLGRRKEVEALRQQIASDLHDDIGSNLSSIALLAELGETEADDSTLAREEFQQIGQVAGKTIEAMRDIVWMIRPENETWTDLTARLRATTGQLLRAVQYEFQVEGRAPSGVVPLVFKRDFFLIYKELLNNIVKHSGASMATICLRHRRGRLFLHVTDNGVGFDETEESFKPGNGLRNLNHRTKQLKGEMKVRSGKGEGTAVQFSAPVP